MTDIITKFIQENMEMPKALKALEIAIDKLQLIIDDEHVHPHEAFYMAKVALTEIEELLKK